jgi:peptidyl-prolyl cis-trans isomerase C
MSQTQPESSTTQKSQAKTMSTKQAFLFGMGVFILVVLIGGYLYVKNGVSQLSEEQHIVRYAEVLKIPVARVDGKKILYADYVQDKQILKNFYAAEGVTPAPTEQEISNQVLARLVANILIADIAKELDVAVTDEDIEEARTAMLAQFPDEETLVAEIESRYGWSSLEKYLDAVVRPALLEQKVMDTYIAANTEDPTVVRAEAQAVLERILSGEAFEPLAAEFGSDGTRSVGGDLGYFMRGDMVPEFEEAAFALEPGTVSPELVETDFGYHIIKVEDKRTTSTPSGDEVEQVRARHILFQTNGSSTDFITYMDEIFRSATIEVVLDIENPFAALQQDGILSETGEPIDEE